MRSPISLFVMLLLAAPALAQDTTALGLGIRQNGLPVPLVQEGDRSAATLARGAFTLTFQEDAPDEVAVLFGTWEEFDQIDLPADMDLFSGALVYAREDRPTAALFLTDRLCGGDDALPGHNVLRSVHRTDAGFPVSELRVDGQSRDCDAMGRLPVGTDLLHLVSPIYATVRTDLGTDRLILRFTAAQR